MESLESYESSVNPNLEVAQQLYGLTKQQPRNWNPHTFPRNELPYYIKRDPLLWRIFSRLHYEDKNVLMLIVGETGIGKSCSALSLANKIDITPLGNEEYKNNFTVKANHRGLPTPETRVVFSARDFMRLVKSNLPKGSAIVWDEAGIENDNTTWYEKKSRLVKYVMQTFRKKNYLLIMTVPDEESVTISTRRLVHLVADVYERNDSYASVDVRWLQRNRRNKKTYPKHTAYYDEKTGFNAKLGVYLLEKLSTSIEKPYNRIKDMVMDNLYGFVEEEMASMDEIEGSLPTKEGDEDIPLKKFDIIKGMEIAEHNLKDLLDKKGEISTSKIILLLAKKGYRCSDASAKSLKDNLVV